MSIADRILRVKSSLPGQVELVAVSKTYPAQRIMEAYEAGQRISERTGLRRWLRSMRSFPRTSNGT